MNGTIAECPMALLFNVPLTVSLPAVIAEVSVAVYVPFPTSITDPRLPEVVESTTVPPLVSKLLPVESLSRTVIVEVLEPSATIDPGEPEMVDESANAGPTIGPRPELCTAEPVVTPVRATGVTSNFRVSF